ncbi:Crp/Fnr family transcriptional regulator [Methylobacterium dankookense]|uniref:Fumarate and nitrate reduction regulatory protein n=1 Tax=Methylobacterium dankookense TaxID=560405 RepID=A0A564G031_9HYPH|nr:Crp/Fnr family transcriptional regulator [Methylobacterium dankookense]GJD55571.1 Fumarate and nitrate reduction regulatory protein [Methylobacterium dankookense]VUF13829.1 Fumarate and nitrate reduction regulatory protein [Methylobacterium dankookense]
MVKDGEGAACGRLRHHELFDELDERIVQAILGRARASRPGAKTLLVRQGDPPKDLILLAAGRAKLSHVTDDGRQTTVRLLGAGDLVGCAAVFRGRPYAASAHTLDACEVYAWPREHLLGLMMSYPRLTMNALAIVSGQLMDGAQPGSMRGNEPARRRLAALILTLTPPADDGGSQESMLRMTRQELGELCGATFFTVSRILSRWARAGIVAPGRGRVHVIDRARLARVATGGASPGRDHAQRCA